ncbi:hypothetical protein GCM10009639_12560 [Kitasatospora putterlickiae]|uniref:DUF4365 domain-containing protein n=1 Tax=Kitasatospora putterlickiae TaxID=221725 RepID=A0ABN1XVU4_9ACTN
MTKVPESRRTERAAVNAVRSLLERAGHIVNEIDGSNDFGEDLYVTFAHHDRRMPYSIAIQVKGGRSFRRRRGFSVPVGSHTDEWRDSNIPVICVVHDPDDDALYWANATQQLRSARTGGRELRTIRIPADAALTDDTVESAVRQWQHYVRNSRGLHAFLSDLTGQSFDLGDYLSYFVNEHGEEAVFQQRAGEVYAMLWHRDLDWEPHRVHPNDLGSLRSLITPEILARIAPTASPDLLAQALAHPMMEMPLMGTIIIDEAERSWLTACFRASDWVRGLAATRV